jgi:ornithine cyclodeaminase
MDPLYINRGKVASLLPMGECIEVMEETFRSIAHNESQQPLRHFMWLPDKSGLLGMMPGYAGSLGVMGIKVISVFYGNRDAGYPSHQGMVILMDAQHGQPLMIFDAREITAIRTAAASAFATRLLSRENSERLAIIGSGEQAEKHIEAMLLVREIKQVNLWSRNEKHSAELASRISVVYNVPISIEKTAREAVKSADIICTVTSSSEPVVMGDWISEGTHINAVGACTPAARELDTAAILRSSLFTDCCESLFNEAGDFLIPKKEGAITDSHVMGELGDVAMGIKKGRTSAREITLFKSLGIAAEDIFSAWHIYRKINQQPSGETVWI